MTMTLRAVMTMPRVLCSTSPGRTSASRDGRGDVGGEGEERDRDDAQRALLPSLGVAAGELPGDGRRGEHLDGGVQPERDQRGGGRDGCRP